MITLNINDIQEKLKKSLKRNYKVLGLDIASRTGWAVIKTDKENLTLDYGFISVQSKDELQKFDEYIKQFSELIKSNYKVVIEDCYFKFVSALKLLAKLEGIAYTICRINEVKEQPMFIGPSSARKLVGCKGNAKKPEVHQWIRDSLGIILDDEDASDAVILAFCGVINEL
jgi:Holliday junction resolvasome RuvABC endonuclease subunit